MITNCNSVWEDISSLSNLKIEFVHVGEDYDIPILRVGNFFKNPDAVSEFLRSGHWWTNGFNPMADSIIRPGKSLYFHEEIVDWFAQPIISPFKALFGVNDVKVNSINGNCFNGNMPLLNALSAFPHTDVVGDYITSPHIAFNINLTTPCINTINNGDRVKTGFWSYMGMKSKLDFSWNDESSLEEFNSSIKDSLAHDSKWFQIEDHDPYKLEEIVTMEYNELVAYPSHFLHNPYIKEHWYLDDDRVTLAGFLNIQPENLNFEDQHLDDVSYAWEFFHLDKIHQFHPRNTKVL